VLKDNICHKILNKSNYIKINLDSQFFIEFSRNGNAKSLLFLKRMHAILLFPVSTADSERGTVE